MADPHADDWRASVQQSYRNNEVREISRVLASLEPGASASSKLRLAMQFEDAVFKAASSLADYRKKLAKRLAKVQKSYVPTQQPAKSKKESSILQLKQQYASAIQYILEHAGSAVSQMRSKHGDEKANQLKQHTDGVSLWAEDLGLLPKTTPNVSMSDEQLEKLTSQLERRLENIRSHVVKLADPDRFLLETMEKTESDMKERASKLLAVNTLKRYEQLQRTSNVDPRQVFQQALDVTAKPIPPPTRNQRDDRKTALIHLEKMRAASTLILGYMMTVDKATLPRQVMIKAHTAAKNGMDFVTDVMAEQRKQAKEPGVSLEDAWMKTLVLPSAAEAGLESPEKRPRTRHRPIVSSRVLLTPGRKTPSNLLPAFKRKRAKLVRPEPRGQGSHLILQFAEVFEMTIFFVPLTVVLRACSRKQIESSSLLHCATLAPLNQGLLKDQELSVWGATGDYESIGHVVEERLRDASVHATHVLRQCFANAVKESATTEFETEIREATVLLEFVQLARTTYQPEWQDADDDDDENT